MSQQVATNITWHEGTVSREERCKNLGQQGITLWFTGLSASGKSTYYTDADGDGYGSPSGAEASYCDPPSGWSSNNTDCLDDNSSVHPGVTDWYEVDRGDGSFDYNCDGEETWEISDYCFRIEHCPTADGGPPSWHCFGHWSTGVCEDDILPDCGESGTLVSYVRTYSDEEGSEYLIEWEFEDGIQRCH